jgi:hypothetical protein
LAQLAERNKWSGIIMFGCIRDVDEIAGCKVRAPLSASFYRSLTMNSLLTAEGGSFGISAPEPPPRVPHSICYMPSLSCKRKIASRADFVLRMHHEWVRLRGNVFICGRLVCVLLEHTHERA